jgi:hypothetical protein
VAAQKDKIPESGAWFHTQFSTPPELQLCWYYRYMLHDRLSRRHSTKIPRSSNNTPKLIVANDSVVTSCFIHGHAANAQCRFDNLSPDIP